MATMPTTCTSWPAAAARWRRPTIPGTRSSASDGRRPIRGFRWCTDHEIDRIRQFWRSFMKATLHGMLTLVAVFLLNVPLARAQVDRATITGIVKDTGG